MKLVDNVEEQRTLEELLDASKPPVPPDCASLHYLLFTPFRYEARSDSRFRRAGPSPAVFYAAERVETAVAEMAFWRLLFFAESPSTPWPANPLELTGFSIRYNTSLCFDLTLPPYTAREAEWRHPTDYAACHAIADEARALGALAIRSMSARDTNGVNLSVLNCVAFADQAPVVYQTWRMKLGAAGVFAIAEPSSLALNFGRDSFSNDPRIAKTIWER